jgi:hypothetical protein
VVWLEQKMKDDSPAELRAVKGIRIPDRQTKPEGRQYVRELEALAKFSQEKVWIPRALPWFSLKSAWR